MSRTVRNVLILLRRVVSCRAERALMAHRYIAVTQLCKAQYQSNDIYRCHFLVVELSTDMLEIACVCHICILYVLHSRYQVVCFWIS